MVYFIVVLASLLLIYGICWVAFIRRWGLWFARNMRSEEKAQLFLSSPAGRIGLWAIRMSGFFYILLALCLFVGLLAPVSISHLPIYAVVILIFILLIPIIARLILVRVMSVLVQKPSSQEHS
jgi:hypothetical protein